MSACVLFSLMCDALGLISSLCHFAHMYMALSWWHHIASRYISSPSTGPCWRPAWCLV